MPKGHEVTVRGRYIAQACNICRARKSKCDGVKPSCGSCTAYGRGEECSWGRDNPSHRKPRTEAHFEALRKRTDALQAYVTVLEGILAKCVCQDVSAHHQYRPHTEGETSGSDTMSIPIELEDAVVAQEGQELSLATQLLKLDDKRGSQQYGNATPAQLPQNERSGSRDIDDNVNASYVLLIDGVDEAACDLNLDWSRHLPKEVHIDRREHDKILDLFLKFFAIFPLHVVPHLFLRDMYRALSFPASQSPPRTTNYSPMLHNAVMALAAAFSDDPYIRETRVHFLAAAKGQFEAECQNPNVSLVHALALLATYHAQEGAIILGEAYCGTSVRIGQVLGLSLDASTLVASGLITSDEMMGRNYAHWTLYTLDVCWALYFGREFVLLPVGRGTPMPLVTSTTDQLPWHHAPANIPPQPNYLSLIFSTSTSLSLIARKIVQVLDGLGHRDSHQRKFVYSNQAITQVDLELNSWKSQLPPEIDITLANRGKSTPQKLMMHCIYWCHFIHLHRPFFSQSARSVKVSDQEIDHIKLCKRAAENTLELLETWSKLYSLRYSPIGLLQLVFSAGTIFILLSLQAALSVRVALQSLKRSLSQAELCVHFLREIGQSWIPAAGTADVLQGLIDTKLAPIITRRGLLVGDRVSSDPAPMATDGPSAVSPDNPHPPVASTSWSWNDPQDMYAIMRELPWPQVHWDLSNDHSANAVDTYASDVHMAPPPRTLTDSIVPPEHWEQRIFMDDAQGR
ncbi:hypothetical protein C8J57DRAFT_213548 [Mycena rebaudengoi]|nr:hypothetical protein C8J57DRAFT_213548 [Mycena rebaudengoi]